MWLRIDPKWATFGRDSVGDGGPKSGCRGAPPSRKRGVQDWWCGTATRKSTLVVLLGHETFMLMATCVEGLGADQGSIARSQLGGCAENQIKPPAMWGVVQEGPAERVENLLTPTLSSTSVWRRGRRRRTFPFMGQPCSYGRKLACQWGRGEVASGWWRKRGKTVRSNPVKPSQTQSNPVKPSQTQSNPVKPSQTQSNPVKPLGLGL
jgi:hypothetical protein